jgi:catechol 2,3-dioxygenase-like lactoylglutathione lyase family enzyme
MPLTSMEHLLVLTDDLEGTKDFYCRALGLEVGERPPLGFAGYWLYLEGVPCVHVADREGYAPYSEQVGLPAAPGAVDHIAFSGTDYEEAAARLAREGIEARVNTPPGTTLRQLFFEDPNGLKVEINVMSREE